MTTMKATSSTLAPADDIASLKQHLPGGRFGYVDIAAHRLRRQALARWPLLAELDAAYACSSRPRAGEPADPVRIDPGQV